jgi:hypothetical protein
MDLAPGLGPLAARSRGFLPTAVSRGRWRVRYGGRPIAEEIPVSYLVPPPAADRGRRANRHVVMDGVDPCSDSLALVQVGGVLLSIAGLDTRLRRHRRPRHRPVHYLGDARGSRGHRCHLHPSAMASKPSARSSGSSSFPFRTRKHYRPATVPLGTQEVRRTRKYCGDESQRRT